MRAYGRKRTTLHQSPTKIAPTEQNLAAVRGAPHSAMHIFLESNNSQRFVRSMRLKRKSLCYAESFVGRIRYFRPSSLAVLVDRGSLGDWVCVTQRLCKGFKWFRIFQVVVGDVDTIDFCCSGLVHWWIQFPTAMASGCVLAPKGQNR